MMNGRDTRASEERKLEAREAIRVVRRISQPRLWQSDYLILRETVARLRREVAALNGEGNLEVLDVGCKYKPYRQLFQGRASRYVGIDLERYWDLEVIGDAARLPFASDSFDLVLCTQAFYLMSHPRRVLEEFVRVTRRGGRVLLTTNGVWPHPPETCLHFWARRELEEVLKEFGEVRVHESGGFLQLVPQLANAAIAMGIEGYLVRRYGGWGEAMSLPLKGIYLTINLLGRGVDQLVRFASGVGLGVARSLREVDHHLALNYLAVMRPRK